MRIPILAFVFFLVTVVHVMSDENPTRAPFCNPTCTSEFDSICAANGSCLKVFSNKCLLEAYNCRAYMDIPFREVDFSYCNGLKHKFCF